MPRWAAPAGPDGLNGPGPPGKESTCRILLPQPSRARQQKACSRRSLITGSCRIASRAAWSRPTARSSGCACRGPIPRASSGRCWTAPPACSGSVPRNTHVPQHRRYVPGTMVLETTWHTPTGWMTVHDLLVVDQIRHEGRRPDYRRAPADFGATGVLLRIATCISGRVEVAVNCAPVFDYGAAGGKWSYKGDGYDSMTIACPDGDVALSWGHHPARRAGRPLLRPHDAQPRASRRSSPCPGGSASPGQPGRGVRRPEHHGRLLARLAERGQDPRPSVEALYRPQRPHPEGPQLRPHRRHHGRRQPPRCRKRPAARATGTTATPGSGTRRSCSARCTAWASTGRRSSTGASSSTRSAAVTSTGKLELQIMYGIGGERDLTEQTLDHLSGYRGARPVRVGNGAWNQHQHDVWGMILDALDVQFRQRRRSDRRAGVGGPGRIRRRRPAALA